MRPFPHLLLAALVLAAPGCTTASPPEPARAAAIPDRAPTAAERRLIEARLSELGYVSWREIELEENGTVWEIDDARTADGRRFEVLLRPDTLELIEAKPEPPARR
jgi:hypothetical protein